MSRAQVPGSTPAKPTVEAAHGIHFDVGVKLENLTQLDAVGPEGAVIQRAAALIFAVRCRVLSDIGQQALRRAVAMAADDLEDGEKGEQHFGFRLTVM